MIIDNLTINDFKNYSGFNTFNFSVTKDKNIILVGGYNGSGKTTLSEAIRLCLYGNRVNGHPLSDSKYQEYLQEVWCNNSKNIFGFSISMRLILDEENPPIVVNITRSFKKNRVKIEESLILKKNDSEIELIDKNYWEYYVEKLIPPNVSRYFFFDGEHVRDAISSSGSKEYLTSAINDLSGVTELLNLNKDLLEVRKKIFSKSSKITCIKRMKELSSKIEDYKKLNLDLGLEIDAHLNKISDLKSKKDDLDQLLNRASGVKESKSIKLNNKLVVANQQYDETNQEFVDFCYNKLPYRIAESNLKNTINRAKNENFASINKYSIELLNNLKKSSVDGITSVVSKNEIEVIDKIINHISKYGSYDDSIILDLTLPRISRMESMVVSYNEVNDFIDKMKIRESEAIIMKDIKAEISKFNDETVDDLINELKNITEQIEFEESECDRIMSIQDFNTSQIEHLRNEVKSEERKTLLSNVDRSALENIDLIEISINKRISLLQAKASSVLVKGINEIYPLLTNKKDMVKEIKLTDSFDIELSDYKEQTINTSTISEGEKGILMYSIIYGLHKISNSHFPLIIDSPLGRMDSLHVKNLVNKFYPTAAEQVIILSHDREITGDCRNMLRNSLSHEYLISKDSNPKVISGYFE